jgi:NOL1/NOP2/sun family putative RNA methylase
MPELMPNWKEIKFKENFVERYSRLTDFEEFKKYSLSFLRRSIRVNTLKMPIPELKKRLEKNWKLEQIPWCKEGFWVEHNEGRRDIGNLQEHALGYFYVQESASMIPPIVLDPKPGEIILDMCASPGSKASQIAQYMKNSGLLIANDYQGLRMKPLSINMQRMGISNTIITLMEGRFFKDFKFDRILVDAPCSGTGAIRKSVKTLITWNPNVVKRLCGTQRQLIETGFNNLKEGGVLVYSTCTLEPEEDEGIVSHLLDKYPNAKLEEIELEGLKRSPAVLEFENVKFNPEVKKCLRIWPQDNDTEGFFVAKIKKA